MRGLSYPSAGAIPGGRVTRRGLLTSSAAVAGSRLIPAAPLATLMVPAPARAEVVTAALAVVSVVAGLIASHNRRGGAMLSAVNQKVDVVINQVADVQKSVALILERLSTLTSHIDELLKEQHVRETHLAIQGAVLRYRDKIQALEPASWPLSMFRRNDGLMQDVQAVVDDLYRAVFALDASKAYGPTTALLLPSAFALEHSLLLLRGDPPTAIATRLERNLSWFDKISDPAQPKSTASYRTSAVRRLDDATRAAAATQFGRALDLKPGTVLFDCAGVNDYRPRSSWRGDCRISRMGDGAEFCSGGYNISERVGPRERMFANLVLEERPIPVAVEIDGRSEVRKTDFNVPVLTRSEPSAVLPEGDPRLPPSCAQVATIDQGNASARASWMRERIQKSPRNADLDQLRGHLASIGMERSRISYADAALAVMAAAKPKIQAAIRDLKAG